MTSFTTLRLREELIRHRGVPNATYLHKNGKIFVFDLLLHHVQRLVSTHVAMPTAISRSLPACWLDPMDAVQKFLIMPDGFVLATQDEHFILMNVPLGAQLATRYTHRADAERAVAHLICGGALSAQFEPHFTYAGQPMRFLFDIQSVINVSPPASPCGQPFADIEPDAPRASTDDLSGLALERWQLLRICEQKVAFDEAWRCFHRTIDAHDTLCERQEQLLELPQAALIDRSVLSLWSQLALKSLHIHPDLKQTLAAAHMLSETHIETIGVWVAAYRTPGTSFTEGSRRALLCAFWWFTLHTELQCLFNAAKATRAPIIPLWRGPAASDPLGLFHA